MCDSTGDVSASTTINQYDKHHRDHGTSELLPPTRASKPKPSNQGTCSTFKPRTRSRRLSRVCLGKDATAIEDHTFGFTSALINFPRCLLIRIFRASATTHDYIIIMKFCLPAIISLAAIPAASARVGVATTVATEETDMKQDLTGRKRKKKKNGDGWSSVLGLTLDIHHVNDSDDLKGAKNDGVILQTYKEAFEEIFDGFESKWAFVDSEVDVPESPPHADSQVGEQNLGYNWYYHHFWLFGGAGCRACDPNLLEPSNALTGTTDSFMHDKRWAQVGDLICDKLRASGIDSYTEVDRCVIRPNYAKAEDVALAQSKVPAPVQKKKNKKNEGWSSVVGLTLDVHHVSGDDDLASVDNSILVHCYNEAFEEVFDGFESKWAFIDSDMDIPESPPHAKSLVGEQNLGYNWYYHHFWLFGGAGCRACDPNLMASLTGTTDSFMHDKRWAQVGDVICDKLRATGIEAYGNVDGCVVHPTYATVDDVALARGAEMSKTATKPVASEGTTEATILVHSVLPSTSTNVELLSKAFADAYNQVHSASDFHVTGVELEREVTVPDGGVASDDNSVSVNGKSIAIGHPTSSDYLMAMYWVKADWSCSSCGGDSALPGLFQLHLYSPDFHTVFESLFCNNLRSSLDEAFVDATGCSITFSAGP